MLPSPFDTASPNSIAFASGSNPTLATLLVPNHADGTLREPFANMDVALGQSDVQLHPLAATTFLVPRSSLPMLLCSTKILPIRPIRQTWPNKHSSRCQLDNSASQQVALAYSLEERMFVRARNPPHSRQPPTCQSDGHGHFPFADR